MSKFRFDLKAARWRGARARMIEEMAANAVHEFKNVAFDSRAWDGVPWAPIKNPRPGSRPLVKSGKMRGSIGVLRKTDRSAIVGSDLDYAQYQNARRQFVGQSRNLAAKNAQVLKKIFRVR